MTRIFIVGSYVQGLTLTVPRMPLAGENLVGGGFDLGPGGKGTNQAIAAARLGARAQLLACLGDDAFGDWALETYAREGIDTRHIQRIANINSGVAFVNVLPDGENFITIDLGANMRMRPQQVRDCAAQIADCDILMTQFEIPPETVRAALAQGKVAGALTILNPAPARAADPAILRHVDVLTPNVFEARMLLGLPPTDASPTPELAERLLALGAGAVVITQGAQGAFALDRGGALQAPAPNIDAVDVTGAGDSFNAALAVSLGEGKSLPDAVRVAVRAGAYACLHVGVIAGLPTRAQLNQFR
ncbi:MAG: ribokinase [Chloroflexi bacterium]|nr:ribokinase [Chloroflexota bacterium]MCY3582272.1 ribokinase [Chloroflexota bacterium]MCY3717144.1 ribokinase [Chloroflexota bacterium]MDE2651733.1 ribokinase [Chloroflexota bacterium]MXV91916.1 ribokinase [Chloroflexota bacterium]